MSTADVFMSPEDIEEFVRESQSGDSLFCMGDEDRELGLCPYLTLYVFHEHGIGDKAGQQFQEICTQVIELYEAFEQLKDEPYQLEWRHHPEAWIKRGDKRLPQDLRAICKKRGEQKKDIWIMATDMASPEASARWAFGAKVRFGAWMRYTTIKLTFRYKWYVDHKAEWHAFVARWVAALQPEHCYSGFEVGNAGLSVMGSYESDVLERICADHFYGLDIDHPAKMGFQYHNDADGWVNPTDLGYGLRTPTWCFMLSPYWLNKLGKSEAQVRAELDDPRIHIKSIPYRVTPQNPEGHAGLWIRLGELSLHPVDKGLPPLLVKASRMIHPIRCDHLRLLSLDPWDDDPNPRFDFISGPQWMARFDEDSSWPTPALRLGKPPEAPLYAMTGETCPRSGLWSPRADVPLPDHHVTQGTPMPKAEWRDSQGMYHQQAIKWRLVKVT